MSAQDGALPNGFGRGRRIALQNAGNASIFEKTSRFAALFIRLFTVIPRFKPILLRRRDGDPSAIDDANFAYDRLHGRCP